MKKRISILLVIVMALVMVMGLHSTAFAANSPKYKIVYQKKPTTLRLGLNEKVVARMYDQYGNRVVGAKYTLYTASGGKVVSINRYYGDIRANKGGTDTIKITAVAPDGSRVHSSYKIKVLGTDTRVSLVAGEYTDIPFSTKNADAVNIKSLANKVPYFQENNTKINIKGGDISKARYTAFNAKTGKMVYKNKKAITFPKGMSEDYIIRMSYNWGSSVSYYYFHTAQMIVVH